MEFPSVCSYCACVLWNVSRHGVHNGPTVQTSCFHFQSSVQSNTSQSSPNPHFKSSQTVLLLLSITILLEIGYPTHYLFRVFPYLVR